MNMKFSLLIVLLLCVHVVLAEDKRSYDVSVTTITAWVRAVDGSGKAVEGLTQDDFEIFEDKQKVDVNCFEEVKQQQAVTAPSDGAPADSFQQKFAIYLDLFNMTPDELTALRPRLKDFLARISVRKPEVMVAALMPNQKLGIACPFTKDTKRVFAVIDKAPGNSKRDTATIGRRDQLIRVVEGAADKIDAIRDA